MWRYKDIQESGSDELKYIIALLLNNTPPGGKKEERNHELDQKRK